METVSIVGVGLIGGSFALALRRAGFRGRLIGVSSPRTIREALRLGVIDEARPLAEAVGQSDLVYLSQPISRILDTVARLRPHLRPDALVTDAGSTKVAIVAAAREHLDSGAFLGGHPMAGKERRGVAAAEAGLFRDRPYLLTPIRAEALRRSPQKEFLEWIRRIGARPVVVSPEEHDRLVARVSHLPQLVSTALAATLAAGPEAEKMSETAGPGLIDTTRLALSPYEIWADILATNTGPIREALSLYIAKLEQLRDRLGSEEIRQEFTVAAGLARKLRNG